MSIKESASAAQSLFVIDQETRRALGGMPYIEDIVAALKNSEQYNAGTLNYRRHRIRLGQLMTDAERNIIGYVQATITNNAKPTKYERTQVWRGNPPQIINGVFLHYIVVRPDFRGIGASDILVWCVRELAQNHGKNLYCDIMEDNIPANKMAVRLGGVRELIWHTPSNTPMLRYRLA